MSFTDKDFSNIVKIAQEVAGLSIPESKKTLVQSRLTKRLRATGTPDFAEYILHVSDASNTAERRELVSALTTNVSSFFRERHHFEHFSQQVLPALAASKNKASSGLRIWSAGCSSGQEAYTIAMECLKFDARAQENGTLILATDIDPAILEKAKQGRYTEEETEAIPADLQQKFFVKSDLDGTLTAKDTLRSLIRFRELNLHANWPMKGKFDAIFCRNVMIYFDDAHQERLCARFRDALAPNGILYLGHSERIHPIEGSGFTSVGITTYTKS